MKLSELPTSLYHSIKLALKPIKAFNEATKERIPVVVSLTTIPSRIKTLHITIRSLLNQEVLPEKIVLWLNDSYKDNIPSKLEKLLGNIFEIRFSPYTFSHRKLIHSIENFPDKVIITCDDDLIYHPSSLKMLYQEHLKNPNVVIGNRCRRITYDENHNPLPYLQWPFAEKTVFGEKWLTPVGAFLVLYPPDILHKNVHDINLFNKLSPKADDLWFKMMTLLNNNLSIKAEHEPPEPIPIIGTQKNSLKKVNKKLDYNRVQWLQLCEYFKLNI
ncbi:glycosyltransferase family 2 protein [Seonamhaeicola sediminis]|uniref:Glycosyltransferase family 2 protein n=1 Tax=Seonamhaeicola sediminis TaxID=2528206 RepID=A0A562YDJ5_9FLAO|nr:glycosyltransferase [Seonamhaeicola sediminis]TWO32685.1 glycosyltransferase family 2 protein [Seonamhaeicola sediminis]